MKSWIEKRDAKKEISLVKLDKKFADIPEGSLMLIATPQIIDEYVKNIPFGMTVSVPTLRNDLALSHQAETTCPLTTGIFLRIVSEAAYEEFLTGKNLSEISPFWRAVDPKSKLAAKLSCGIDFIVEQRNKEL